MRIISNFKDYYDFMTGKYGIDPKVVYTRIPEGPLYVPHYKTISPDRIESWVIHFCGKTYFIYYTFGDWFFGSDILKANPRKYPTSHFPIDNPGKTIREWKSLWDEKKNKWIARDLRVQGAPTDVNEKMKCPVVVGDIINPKLADFNFAKIFSPEDAFITISNWLSREKEIINLQTDKEKVVSHGFDLKKSFRK
jgi:hypothetical protein